MGSTGLLETMLHGTLSAAWVAQIQSGGIYTGIQISQPFSVI